MNDLKKVYQAPNKSQAETELLNLEEIWGKKYPVVIRSWNNNWEKLSTYFQYDESIRKLIYTTNAVEGFHRQIRKVTKTKGAFPNDMALLKLIYLATMNVFKKMDTTASELGAYRAAAMHKIWRPNENQPVIFNSEKQRQTGSETCQGYINGSLRSPPLTEP
jgi:transposase-like protein